MIKHQKSNRKAFTTTEILVVISLIGIIVLISFPAFRAYKPSLELSGTVRELVTDFRYAEQLAVAEQINHGVRFSFSPDKYEVVKYGATEMVLKEKLLPSEVSLHEVDGFTGDEVIFNPYGAVLESGTITLVNTKDSTTVLDIRPSGFVKVIEQ